MGLREKISQLFGRNKEKQNMQQEKYVNPILEGQNWLNQKIYQSQQEGNIYATNDIITIANSQRLDIVPMVMQVEKQRIQNGFGPLTTEQTALLMNAVLYKVPIQPYGYEQVINEEAIKYQAIESRKQMLEYSKDVLSKQDERQKQLTQEQLNRAQQQEVHIKTSHAQVLGREDFEDAFGGRNSTNYTQTQKQNEDWCKNTDDGFER